MTHELRRNSTDYGFSEPPPIFPCRPCLTVKNGSHCLQRKACIGDLEDSVAWLRSLRPIPRVIVVIVPLMCAIVASTLVESNDRAQTASPSSSTDRFAKFIAEAPARLAVQVHRIRAVIQIESAGDAHLTSPRGAMGLMQLRGGVRY
jgi:soluble lytic murein transglycosylase-like protein